MCSTSDREISLMKRFRAKASRSLGFETLESRALMTAEGQAFAVDQTLDVSDLFGAISGTIAWRLVSK